MFDQAIAAFIVERVTSVNSDVHDEHSFNVKTDTDSLKSIYYFIIQ